MKPKRIQLSRMKGWRKPEGAIVVARPSQWGNPYRVGDIVRDPVNSCNNVASNAPQHDTPGTYERTSFDGQHYTQTVRLVTDRADAVELFWRLVAFEGYDLASLAGHDLACWCPLDQPCHADVLLELANR